MDIRRLLYRKTTEKSVWGGMARESKTRKDGRIHVTWGKKGVNKKGAEDGIGKAMGKMDRINSGIHLLKSHNKIHYFVC